jgi:hypothetical protein
MVALDDQCGHHAGGSLEDGNPLVPRRPRPGRVRGARGRDRPLDLGGATLLDIREHVRVAMRHDGLEGHARFDPLSTDHIRDVNALGGHLLEPCAQLRSLR